jgi:hypothetical protein
MKPPAIVAALVLCATGLAADSRRVEADDKTDFSVFKTFSILDGQATSKKTEIDNSLTLKTIEEAIRKALSSSGLKETQDRPNLIVRFSVVEESQRHVTGRGIRDMQVNSRSVGTLVIEMTNAGTNLLVWHGTYSDDESTAANLAKNLPNDAKKLLSEYPPKKR